MKGHHFFALGYLSAGEATSDNGVHRTRGAAKIAKADEARRVYLESYADEWRRESRAHRAKMQFAAYRKGKVPA